MIRNYNELPIGKYMEILAAVRDIVDPVERQVRIISVLSDKPVEEVFHLPIAEYMEMARASLFLETPATADGRVAKEYRLGGMTLRPVTDWKTLETAQYVDLQTYIAAPDTDMASVLSCLLVPAGHRYNDGYDMDALRNAVKGGMTVSQGTALLAFFLKSFAASTAVSLNFCGRALKDLKRKERRVPAERLATAERKIMEAAEILRGAGAGSPMSTL